mmetsp:Transcript_44782/g.52493  ORF Transcript_44782/g.52493 Transcript_44782/m.52493 type:complete len:311 (-) Transcript_44782:23-955(-)
MLGRASFLTEVLEQNGTEEEVYDVKALTDGLAGEKSDIFRYLSKRRELEKATVEFESKKKNNIAHNIQYNARRAKFLKKQEELKKQVVKFEKFVYELDSKRNRAEASAKNETALEHSLEGELILLRKNIEECTKKKDQICSKLNRCESFRKFMSSVVDSHDEFEQIDDILGRQEILHYSNNELQVSAKRCALASSEQGKMTKAFFSKAKTRFLVHNDKRNRLQHQLDLAQGRNETIADERDRIKRRKNEKSREIGQILMTIKSMHRRSCDSKLSKCITHEERSDLSHQFDCLNIVGDRLEDINDIIKSFK